MKRIDKRILTTFLGGSISTIGIILLILAFLSKDHIENPIVPLAAGMFFLIIGIFMLIYNLKRGR